MTPETRLDSPGQGRAALVAPTPRRLLMVTLATAVALLLIACGGRGSDANPVETILEEGAATEGPAVASPASAGDAAGDGVQPGPSVAGEPTIQAGTVDDDSQELGEAVFTETAGGVGCASCVGMDGRGKPELAARDIRGRTAEDVYNALETRTQMAFIDLTSEEVNAVAAYLKRLGERE